MTSHPFCLFFISRPKFHLDFLFQPTEGRRNNGGISILQHFFIKTKIAQVNIFVAPIFLYLDPKLQIEFRT